MVLASACYVLWVGPALVAFRLASEPSVPRFASFLPRSFLALKRACFPGTVPPILDAYCTWGINDVSHSLSLNGSSRFLCIVYFSCHDMFWRIMTSARKYACSGLVFISYLPAPLSSRYRFDTRNEHLILFQNVLGEECVCPRCGEGNYDNLVYDEEKQHAGWGRQRGRRVPATGTYADSTIIPLDLAPAVFRLVCVAPWSFTA